MNGFFAFFLFASYSIALTSSMPTLDDSQGLFVKMMEEGAEEEPSLVPLEMREETEQLGGRFSRATCDLLSVSTKWGSLNHSACAAHCLAMRRKYRGGYCSQGVCHCRR